MRLFSKWLVASSLLLLCFTACTKQENKIYLEDGTAPVLTANRVAGSTLTDLTYANRDKALINFMWTNPNYKFTTGVSSQDVTYTLEIDTLGKNFTSPGRIITTISKDLMKAYTVGEFNGLLLNTLQLDTTRTRTIECRITSSMVGNTAQLLSNVLRFQVKPYAIPPVVDPPASNELFITGGATPASWMGGGDAPVISQKFTRVSNTLYQINSILLTGGGSYLFVPIYGDWSDKFGFDGGGNNNNVDSDIFRRGGNDIKAPAATGNYKIVVDFQRGRFTLAKL